MSTTAKSLLNIWPVRLGMYESSHVSPHPAVVQAAKQLAQRLRHLPAEEPIEISYVVEPLHAKFIREKTGEVLAEIKEEQNT